MGEDYGCGLETMKTRWIDIAEMLVNRSQDIYMECHSCTSPDYCISVLPIITPISITSLNSCCSCMLNHILDTIPNIGRMYLKSKTTDEYVVVYALGDVVIEVSESGALIVPIDKIYEFLDILRELDDESLPSIVKWLESEGFKI